MPAPCAALRLRATVALTLATVALHRATVALTLATVGCSPGTTSGTNAPGGSTVDPLTQLQNRASLEHTVAAYTTMEAEIRAAVTAAAPGVTWVLEQEATGAGCRAPFDGLNGRSLALESWGAPGGIPDEAWPAALTAAVRIAARYGFDSTQRFVDKPGRHDARLSNSTTGAYTNLGTYVNAVLSTITGCHLPASTTTAGPPRATPA